MSTSAKGYLSRLRIIRNLANESSHIVSFQGPVVQKRISASPVLNTNRLPGNRTLFTRNKDAKVNHAEQLAVEMQQGRINGRTQSFQRFRADSQSSQDSIEDESRQSAAEKAAAALMNGDVRPTPQQPLAKKSNPQSFEMSQNMTGNRKLRREHLANLAHLQSSSC